MVGYCFKDGNGRVRTSGFSQVVDITTRKDLAAMKPGGQVRVICCTFAPVLSCLVGSKNTFGTYKALMLGAFSLIVLWQATQLLPTLLTIAG